MKPEATQNIEILTPFSYKVIYVFRINDEAHRGLLKIGETTLKRATIEGLLPNSEILNEISRKRIDEYTKTAGIQYELLHTELAVGKKSFGDKDVHRILINSGYKRTPPKGAKGREWFTINLATAKAAIQGAKEGVITLTPGAMPAEQDPIELRREQRLAVDHALMRFKATKSVLWHAKMRFGKTIATLSLIKEAKYRRVIVITHRPVVKEGWFEDYKLVFANDRDICFFRKDMGDVSRFLRKKDCRLIYFASIHDLRGSSSVGGKFEKNDDIYDVDWDLLVIDEAHEGTQTILGQNVIDALVKKNTKILSLSGTPFNIQDDFNPEDVYTWDYISEQRAKRDWAKEHEGDSNPYAGLPEMRMFTYALGAVFQNYEEYSIEGKCFNFREFFRTWTGDETHDEGRMPEGAVIGDFVHHKDVKKFVELLRAEGYDNNYPFTTKACREALCHTLWKIPGVKEAKALERLLKEDLVFSQFEIINVAGSGNADEDEDENDLIRVKEAIAHNPYTITLSCGRLTTGVTVKEWTGVLMLAGGDKVAAANYLQTIFRVQSPYTDEEGRIKDLCYAFDFAPDRVLTICPKMVENEVRPPTGGTKPQSEKTRLGTLLNFLPIISVKGSELHTFEVSDIYKVIKRYAAEKAIRHGFADSSIYNFSKLKLENINVDDFNKLRGIIGKTLGPRATSDVELSQTGMTEEERKKAKDAKKNRKKRVLTEEEKEYLARLKEEKRQRQNAIDILRGISIRMPLLIYGANVDYTEDITIAEFVSIVDDESWEEFMPKGVTKELFAKFVQYYDEGVFTVASREIRSLARNADGYAPTDRVIAIAKIFSYFRNPDKETVLTPWRVVNMHLSDTVGGWNFFNEDYTEILDEPRYVEQAQTSKKLFSKDEPHILELNSKSGLYPLYLTYSIFREKCEKLKTQKVELTRETQQKVWSEIVKNNIFVVCKTPMAKSITRRTLLGYKDYEVDECNLEYFVNLIHVLKYNADKFVRNVKNPKTWNKEGITAMEFDAIVGNPPYQMMDGGAQASAGPIYHYFVDAAKRIGASYISMIMPARWYIGGPNLEEFKEEMLEDTHIQILHDYLNATAVFPNVDIKGGICYFLRNLNYTGVCNYILHDVNNKISSMARMLKHKECKSFIRYPHCLTILEKVKSQKEESFNTVISSGKAFDLRTDFFKDPKKYGYPEISEVKIVEGWTIYGLENGKRACRYVGRDYPIRKNEELINQWKLFVPYAYGSGSFGEEGPKSIIAAPGSLCTETFLCIGPFATKEICENVVAYMRTRFFRLLVGIMKITQHCTKEKYQFVPMQDFSKPWTDEELYAKYGLTEEEIAFVESMIRPMEVKVSE